MTASRPVSHQIGDAAVAQVTSIFSKEGWIVERTSADYGEDLCVQICKRGQISPFRLYIQVKGTRSLKSHEGKGYYRVSGIKTSTVDRWLNASYMVLLILWDITKETGVYAFVDDFQIDASQRRVHSRTITVKIPGQNSLNNKSGLTALRIRSILTDKKSEGLKVLGSIAIASSETVRSKEMEKTFSLGIQLLCDLELMEEEEGDGKSLLSATRQCNALLAENFSKQVVALVKRGGGEEEFTAKRGELLRNACILVILSQVERLTGDPVHLTIMGTAALPLIHYFEHYLGSISLLDLGAMRKAG
jgi:hypothetical protein